jgi:hypothetical protein
MVPNGGDIGVFIGAGERLDVFYQAGPLCNWTESVVMGCPLHDSVKFMVIFLCFEGYGEFEASRSGDKYGMPTPFKWKTMFCRSRLMFSCLLGWELEGICRICMLKRTI